MLAIKYITGRVGWAKATKAFEMKGVHITSSCIQSAACKLSIWIHHFTRLVGVSFNILLKCPSLYVRSTPELEVLEAIEL